MRKTEEEILPYWICSGCNTTNDISKKRCDHCGHGREHGLVPITFAQQDKWIKVEDGLPEEEVYVLVAASETRIMVVCQMIKGKFVNRWDNSIVYGVTHYQAIKPPNSTPST